MTRDSLNAAYLLINLQTSRTQYHVKQLRTSTQPEMPRHIYYATKLNLLLYFDMLLSARPIIIV